MEEIETYLDTILYGGPERNEERAYLEKMQSLPAAGLVALAERLPTVRLADRVARRALLERADEVPDQVALDGLRRDARFVTLCTQKGLVAEAARILRLRLRDRLPLPRSYAADVLKVVISHTPIDTELAADLHWHFVHAGWRQRDIAPLLHDLEGFDFETAIAEAWQIHRAGRSEGEQSSLAPYALGLGDKEALRLTLQRLPGMSEPRWRTPILQLLAPRLAIDLPPEDAFQWAVEHFTELTYNPATGTFGLEGR